MPEFFETRMGHTFYDGTMPRIARALETIAEQMTKPQTMTPDQEATLRTALRAFRVVADDPCPNCGAEPRDPLAVLESEPCPHCGTAAPTLGLGTIDDVVDLLRDVETFCQVLAPLTSVELEARQALTARITMVLTRLESER